MARPEIDILGTPWRSTVPSWTVPERSVRVVSGLASKWTLDGKGKIRRAWGPSDQHPIYLAGC